MTPEYTRGYGKGYRTGYNRAYRYVQQLISIIRVARHRAERAEQAQGLGMCSECALWERHSLTALWGRCQATEPGHRMTLEQPWFYTGARGDDPVVTSQGFGCVLFRPKPHA